MPTPQAELSFGTFLHPRVHVQRGKIGDLFCANVLQGACSQGGYGAILEITLKSVGA